jgi:proton-conducting membrane transporter
MTEDLYAALPELVLAGGAMVLLMLGAFQGERTTGVVLRYAIALLAVAGFLLWRMPDGKVVAYGGSFVVDDFAKFLKIVTLIGSIGALLLSGDFLKVPERRQFEYPVLILLSTTGMLMLISAADLIALYLGLELMSLALYVVAAIDRDNVRSTEAGLKYFVLGALSSGMLLYGASLIYGFTGTVKFAGIAQASADGGIGLTIGLVLLFAGLCFKVSAVPFHMWTPDVYQGAPTPITAFFAAAPKVAAIAVFMRASLGAFPAIATQWQQIIVFVSLASMGLGSFAAIGQRNFKRLMAYRPHGLRSGRPCSRYQRRRQGCARLHVDLCRHDARHFRVHRRHAPPGQAVRGHHRSRWPRPQQSHHGVLPRHADVLHGRRAAARGLLCQVVRVPRRHRCRPDRARGPWHDRQRNRLLLLPDDRQDHVFRRSGAGVRPDGARAADRCWRQRPVRGAVLDPPESARRRR